MRNKFAKDLKYSLKNLWDIFPGINEFQLIRNATKVKNSLFSEEIKAPSSLKIFGRIFLTSVYITCGIITYFTGSLNPQVWNEKIKEDYAIIELKQQYQNQISSFYDSLNIFENAENFEDSLEIYQKQGLPIKLEPINFEEKESVVNKKNLEEVLE